MEAKLLMSMSRRELLRYFCGIGPAFLLATPPFHVKAQDSVAGHSDRLGDLEPLAADLLPTGIRSRFVNGINDLNMHVLEAGFESPGRPALLLLHGFPDLAYGWRHLMPKLAEAGYHVIAPDQRGYGRTTGWDADYDGDLASFRRLNLVRDALGLVHAFGYESLAGVIGHDFGSPIAAWCAVARPDVFRTVTLMSAPYGGTPSIPFDTVNHPAKEDSTDGPGLADQLAALPRPRKHYQNYYSSRQANENIWHPPQGLHDFLRAYYHVKSGDWGGNHPVPLSSRRAEQMARMPTYYIMELDKGMAETVAEHMPTPEEIASNNWLTDNELSVYVTEFERTGFQGGLNWYRAGGFGQAEQQIFARRTIDQPSIYIAGSQDWGSYQSPGALEQMQNEACTDFRGIHMIDGAGHWVQQEKPDETARQLLDFLRDT